MKTIYDIKKLNGLNVKGNFERPDTSEDVSRLNRVLKTVGLKVDEIVPGPAVTTYISNLGFDTDIKKALKLDFQFPLQSENVTVTRKPTKILIEKYHGLNSIYLGDIYDGLMSRSKMKLPLCVGVSTSGTPIFYDLAEAPHMLVAGTTGSGKSIFLHSLICSLLMSRPHSCGIFGIDPKGTEFNKYAEIGSFTFIDNAIEARKKLSLLCNLMDQRYSLLKQNNCRDIDAYNDLHDEKKLCRIVVVIDEFADLMFTDRKSVESYVVRLAQKARAAGIHLIIATQKPSADVFTGLIKANIPTRVSLKVASHYDSGVILGQSGAENLAKHGDLIFIPNGGDPVRCQGVNVTPVEMQNVAFLAEKTVGKKPAEKKPMPKRKVNSVTAQRIA